jgi:geranylgeranyl reductase family protein
VENQLFTVIIIGAGPAGAACALRLSKSGYKVLVIEKDIFPRDKTCGDALSEDVINQLPMIADELLKDFLALPAKLTCGGVKIVAPDGTVLDIPYIIKGEKRNGFICKRIDFDHLLYDHLAQSSNIQVIQDCNVLNVEQKGDCVWVHTSKGIFKTKMVVGADGAKSVVAHKLGTEKLDRKHFIAGLRVYYEGVTHFHEENFIELYLFEELMPGYLWVFPLPGNQANVGLGMIASEVAKKKINLKETLTRLLDTHPDLKERFKNATPLETIKGHGLPIGSKKRIISGERFLLVGDAAGLIDPITGEGVGNSIRSGRIAADHLIKCIEQNNYSAAFNKGYDQEIYRRMWSELKISRRLLSMYRHTFLVNTVIRTAKRNIQFLRFMVDATSNFKTRNVFTNPAFYYRLLFNNKK